MDAEERTQMIIADAGYEIRFRQNEWTECLLVSRDDRWIGMGVDPPSALHDALRQALPSRLARQLLSAVAASPSDAAPLSPSLPTAFSAPPAPLASRPETAPAPITPDPAAPARSVAPAPIAAPALAVVPPTVATPAVVEPQSPAAKPAAPAEANGDAEPAAKLPSAREVLDELRSMRKQIEVDAEELALFAPKRQRLVLLGWITRARAAQMSWPDDNKIDTAVANIARSLTGYCQTWWPGSVRALKVTTRPEDIVVDLTMPVDRPPSNWQEACELAERNVRVVEEDDETRGKDGYGWSDASRLSPPPRDADAMLAEIIREVEALSGPIGAAATKTEVPDPPKFLEWARKLRWARETMADPLRWGALLGRFRFWIRENPQKYPDASRALDADYCPDRSWAALLGLDPETIARAREIRDIFASPPKPAEDGTIDEAAVTGWIARALTYSDTHLGTMVSSLRPVKDYVLGLEDSALPNPDRRMRRRFAKLQKELALPTPSQMPPPEEPEVVEVVESPSDPTNDANAIPEALRGPVVAYTRGKRALFVSNRADPNLRDRLREIFEFEDLDWSAGETKRRQSLVGPIQSGSYHFVLGATGFLSHSIDGQISQACRKGQVPYVRVHRGRPLACLRAMARELGLEENSGRRAALEDA